jgi:transcriptional regulator with XRE-family HTH domain
MNTPQYLDAVKRHLGIESDYALAKRLGFSQSAMSSYRTGRRVFDDDAALTVALALGVNPLQVIAAANAERSKTDEQKARWTGLMEKFSGSFRNLLSQWDGHTERRATPRVLMQ